jgi:O-antigen ligase
MLFSIYLYAFVGIKFYHFSEILIGIIILGSIPIFFIHKNNIFKDPIVILFFLVLILEVFSWINSLIYFSDFANTVPKVDRLGKLFLFFPVAYWLRGDQKNIILLWLFFLLGFIITCFTNVSIQSIITHTLNQERMSFLIKNAQFDSMFAGSSLIISLSLFYTTFRSHRFSTNLRFLFLGILSILVILFLYITIITQSRQVWLGLVGAMFFAMVCYFFIYKIKNIKFIFLSILLFLGIIAIFGSTQVIQKRFLKEKETIQTIVLLDSHKQIKMSSLGVRVNSWIDATEWIKKHPLVGLGPEAIPEVIQQSNRFSKRLKKKYGHLHNFFIEIVVAYGFIGLSLIFAIYYIIIKSIKTSSLPQEKKRHYLLISISFTIYWFIINNFEVFNSRHLGIFTHTIIFASFYTFHLKDYLQDNYTS